MKTLNLKPPTGDEAISIARSQGVLNGTELGLLAGYIAGHPDFVNGHVTAERLRMTGEVLDDAQEIIDSTLIAPRTTATAVAKLRKELEYAQEGNKQVLRANMDLLESNAQLLRDAERANESLAREEKLNTQLREDIDRLREQLAEKKETKVVFAYMEARGEDLDPADVGAELAQEIALALAEEQADGSPAEEPKTVESALAKLEALGSPDAIAAFFANVGITGKPRRATSCPVANYLKREFDTPVVAVYERAYTRKAVTATPPTVFAFIQNFDNGEYPDLIA
jgi:hypothetical protein